MAMDIFISPELLSENPQTGGHFLRINKYGVDTEELLLRFFDLAVKHGAFLEKGMANPTAGDIAYFESVCAAQFRLDRDFIRSAAKKFSTAPDSVIEKLSASLYDSLSRLKSEGKNDSILKNIFIKFMCWLRRDIARALAPSKEKYPPKILCGGMLSRHEMMMLAAAAAAGCDILIAEYDGSEYFDKLPDSEKTAELINVTGGADFPRNFSLSDIRKKADEKRRRAAVISSGNTGSTALKPASKNGGYCVNAWLTGDIYADILTTPEKRGNEPDTVYTCYVRINGAENKAMYLSDLYRFYMKLREMREPVIIENGITAPSNDEIAAISRGNYRTPADMVTALSANIVHSDVKLQAKLRSAFAAVMDMYFAENGNDVRKGISKAVFLLCFLKRYQGALFGGTRTGFPCLIIFGGCKSLSETMFVKMIARCPADVLILCPDLSRKCELSDDLLYERNFTESLPAEKFPRENGDASMGTVAYYAERELDTMMYTDTGIYRSHQYAKANSVVLRTMYEEIPLLWNTELKYRPNFSTSGGTVNMPVIMAKISGVKDNDLPRYWNEIHGLISAYPDSIVYKGYPIINDEGSCEYAVGLMRNGRLNRSAVKEHKNYRYGFLKEETQDYILDKLSAFLEAGVIREQKSGGLEYKIIHIALNMSSDILRLIQKFDFTAVNPKVIYISTGEDIISRSDSIYLAFLNRLGFDVVFYIPTGYQSAEKYYTDGVINCLETGEYVFDLAIPDLSKPIADPKKSIFKRIFGKEK